MNTSQIVTAWRGLEPFAHWLVQTMDPKLVIELGVDYGFSLIELARYNRGKTIGVDHFVGDEHAGFRSIEDQARENIRKSELNISLMNTDFDTALKSFEDEEIDILHLDGVHTFEHVHHDFHMWFPKVRRGGVILLHDTQSFPQDVGRFFRSLDLPKFEILYSHGLGVVTKL